MRLRFYALHLGVVCRPKWPYQVDERRPVTWSILNRILQVENRQDRL